MPTARRPVAHRFDGLVCSVTDQGALTLDDGVAQFDCTIHQEVTAGDHVIVLLQLHAVAHAEASMPLIFHHSGFGQLSASA